MLDLKEVHKQLFLKILMIKYDVFAVLTIWTILLQQG